MRRCDDEGTTGCCDPGIRCCPSLPGTGPVQALAHHARGLRGWLVPEQAGTTGLHGHPDANEPWKRATVPFATSVTSWSTMMLAATTAVRRTGLPAPIAAVLLGGGLIAIDSFLADRGEAREAREAAKASEAREAREAVKAAEADASVGAPDPTR
jgi:hypothetical protein